MFRSKVRCSSTFLQVLTLVEVKNATRSDIMTRMTYMKVHETGNYVSK